MKRRYRNICITRAALRIETMHISVEALDYDENPCDAWSRRDGNARPTSADTPKPIRRDERDRTIGWRDRP